MVNFALIPITKEAEDNVEQLDGTNEGKKDESKEEKKDDDDLD